MARKQALLEKRFCPHCGIQLHGSYVDHAVRAHPGKGELFRVFFQGDGQKGDELSDREIAAVVRDRLGEVRRGHLHWGKTRSGLLILSDRDIDEVLANGERD
jgi:hypothetical protein